MRESPDATALPPVPGHSKSQASGSAASGADRDWSWAQPAVTIGSLVLAVLMPPVGLVGSIIALMWAARTGTGKTIPIIGIIVATVMIVLFFVLVIAAFVVFRHAIQAGALDFGSLCARRDDWSMLLDLAGYECK